MKRLAVFAFAALALALSPACSTAESTADAGATDAGDGGTKALTSPDCPVFCQKVRAAACPSAGACETDCQNQLRMTPSQCRGEVLAVIACSANEGQVVGCDDRGKARLQGCEAPVGDYLGCLLGTGNGDAGLDAGPAPRCEDVTTGKAACDTCMDKSCCAEEAACAGSPDCVAFEGCVGRGTARATCEGDHPKGSQLSDAVTRCRGARCGGDCS